MKKKYYITVLLILIMVISSAGCSNNNTKPVVGQEKQEQKVYNWKLASCWADGTFLFDVDKRFCELVSQLSNGQLNIKPYGVGQLAPANQVFDVVSNGTVECGGDWPSYWTGKNTGFDLLATNLMGFSNWDYYIWIYEAGGLDVYNKMFGKFGMVYFPTAITGMESGIRSNKPINKLSDMQGMKIRFAGKIQGMLIQKFGVTPASIAANELYEALQRGVIDAAEYSGPYNDDILKIQEVTKYWLTPGWHQTASVYGVMINEKAYNSLPEEIKSVIDIAAKACGHEYTARYAYKDSEAAKKILESGVKTTSLSEEEMDKLEQVKVECLEEMAGENPDYAYVLKSQIDYLKSYEEYRNAQGEWGFGRNWKYYPKL